MTVPKAEAIRDAVSELESSLPLIFWAGRKVRPFALTIDDAIILATDGVDVFEIRAESGEFYLIVERLRRKRLLEHELIKEEGVCCPD